MKYLSDYMESEQTEAFKEYGAFFAFSNEQLDKKKVEGVKYASLGSGLIVPVDNAELLVDRLELIHTDAIKQDIDENGIDGIIQHELNNHECFYTGNYDDVVDVLKSYNITIKQIANCYRGLS